MKSYIGTKIIKAIPQENGGEKGYKVIYPDGYESWSPEDVFDSAYREITRDEIALVSKEDIYFANSTVESLVVAVRNIRKAIREIKSAISTLKKIDSMVTDDSVLEIINQLDTMKNELDTHLKTLS